MITFQQTFYKILLILKIGVQAVFALQIEAPKEIEEFLWAYSAEIGAQTQNAILRANNNTLKLIKNGKTVNEVKIDPTIHKNIALQNAVYEIFGHPTQKTSNFIGNLKTILIGTGFITAGVLLYYSNSPKPVYEEKK